MHAPAFSVDPPGSASGRGSRGGLVSMLRETGARLLARIRRVRAEGWWLLLFACLLLAFGLALVFQPTVGRGGR